MITDAQWAVLEPLIELCRPQLRARVGCNVIATDKRHTSRAGSFMIGGKGRPDTRQKIGVSSSPR